MSKPETDLIDIVGGLFSFLLRYKVVLFIGLVAGLLISVVNLTKDSSEVSGECILRLGGAGNSYMTDVLIVLDEVALFDGLVTDLDEKKSQWLRAQLKEFYSIEFSVYQRSSIKCLVRYNEDALDKNEAELALIEAIRNNQTISEFIKEKSMVMQEELQSLETYLDGLIKVNKYVSENTEGMLDAKTTSIVYPGVVEITTRKSDLQHLLQRINWVRVISPLRTESKTVSQFKYSVLAIILMVIMAMCLAGLHSMLKTYRSRQLEGS
tara:strand:+ start:605 stop:1402 length:798 start_codon:yes stop_codon:yes gene_type:complete